MFISDRPCSRSQGESGEQREAVDGAGGAFWAI